MTHEKMVNDILKMRNEKKWKFHLKRLNILLRKFTSVPNGRSQ